MTVPATIHGLHPDRARSSEGKSSDLFWQDSEGI